MAARNVQVVFSDPADIGLIGVTLRGLYETLGRRLRSEACDPDQPVVIDTGNGRGAHLPVYGIADSTDRVVMEL